MLKSCGHYIDREVLDNLQKWQCMQRKHKKFYLSKIKVVQTHIHKYRDQADFFTGNEKFKKLSNLSYRTSPECVIATLLACLKSRSSFNQI